MLRGTDGDALVELKREVESKFGTGPLCIYRVDLCSREQIYAAAANVKEVRVYFLVNNAGIVSGKPFWSVPTPKLTER